MPSPETLHGGGRGGGWETAACSSRTGFVPPAWLVGVESNSASGSGAKAWLQAGRQAALLSSVPRPMEKKRASGREEEGGGRRCCCCRRCDLQSQPRRSCRRHAGEARRGEGAPAESKQLLQEQGESERAGEEGTTDEGPREKKPAQADKSQAP